MYGKKEEPHNPRQSYRFARLKLMACVFCCGETLVALEQFKRRHGLSTKVST